MDTKVVVIESCQEDCEKATKSSSEKYPLLSFDEVPSWCSDNPFIRHGYRPESQSCKKCLSSLLYVHNETVNIYSHFLPALIFLLSQGLVIAFIWHTYPDARLLDYIIICCFLLTAFVTLMLSAAFHALINHSEKVCDLWLRLDYGGILVLTAGLFVSGIYMCFFCDPLKQKIYWTMILSLATITAVLVIHPRLQGLRWRKFRVGAFVLTGLTGFAPLGHATYLYGWSHMWVASGMPYYVLEGIFLIIGAACYATRFPERFAPGKFDLWGSSHNLFHVLVVIATIIHLIGIYEAYDWNYHHAICRRP